MMFWYRARRWLRRKKLAAILILLLFGAGFSLVYFGAPLLSGFAVKENILPAERLLLADPYDLTDYTEVIVDVFSDGVLFKYECRGLWIAMPYEKSFAIKRNMAGVFDIRPTQHDLLYDVITNYDINMSYARIERMQNNFFYATVLLEHEEKLLQLDSRPSDALALAARFKAPVYVSTKLLQQQGRDICRD